MHITEGKLESRAKKEIFVGYPDGFKGYRIWLSYEKKCIISIDVILDENRRQQSGSISQTHIPDCEKGMIVGCVSNVSHQLEIEKILSL